MNTARSLSGLGIDAGGTRTRWALAGTSKQLVAHGETEGMTALQMSTDAGREHIRRVLRTILAALPQGNQPVRICAGITGHTEGGAALNALIADEFSLPQDAVSLRSDIEIAYLDLFLPGQGYVIYAGTGTVAAFIDEAETFHRAGGRGAAVDDAGGGYWIAIEALRNIWREEDLRPGAWRDSPLAVEMFNRIGGSEWALSRQFIYQRARGEIGMLALAVAAAAEKDAVALDILVRAGVELARLGQALLTRFGPKPIALAGRAVTLHPAIEASLRKSLPVDVSLEVRHTEAHVAAANIAAVAAAAVRPNPAHENN